MEAKELREKSVQELQAPETELSTEHLRRTGNQQLDRNRRSK